MNREELGIDDYLELLKEDKNLNGAYISFGQYIFLLERENKQLIERIDKAMKYIKDRMIVEQSFCLDMKQCTELLDILKGEVMNREEKYVYDELECSYNDDFVKCPYCGFEDYDVYDGLNIDAKEYGYPNCGKNFGVAIEQKIEFTSFPIDEKEGK